MRKDYYNTNREVGKTLKRSRERAQTQQAKILKFFRKNPYLNFTPFEIQKHVFEYDAPITSVRRAITNLEQMDLLKKTTLMRDGKYGKQNHTWKLQTGIDE